MSDIISTFTFSRSGIDFAVNIVCLNEYAGFGDQWKMTDDHQGGVTIKNPQAGRGSYHYGIPQQTTLAELASAYAKQGRVDPSAEAYKSLQRQLDRDIDASDYTFDVTAKIEGITLFDREALGFCFDYSYQDEETLAAAAADVWSGNGLEDEAFTMAQKAAKEILSSFEAVKRIAEA